MTSSPALRYPHMRNDCEACRERDADFHLAGAEHNPPGKRPARYCRACIGEKLVALALYGPGRDSPAEPLTVTVELLAPGEGAW